MLEIVLLIFLCKKMGSLLRKKGWKPLFMQILVVFLWFGAEVSGAFAYGVYVMVTQGMEAAEGIGWAAYLWALLAAVLGQLLLFGFAWLLPTQELPIPSADSTGSGNGVAPITPSS